MRGSIGTGVAGGREGTADIRVLELCSFEVFERKCTCISETSRTAQIKVVQTCFHCGPCRCLWPQGFRGSGWSLPYLRGHSANGGQVIPSTQEVWSVDLQLKVAQPLDNGLWALRERRQGVCCHWLRVCFFNSHFFSAGPNRSHDLATAARNSFSVATNTIL